MCGPFKSHGGILRLLEMIFSGVALILVLFRGGLANPWGVWCHFVWFFCFLIPLLITVAEALKLQVLMAMFLPDWSDLTCGLTMICTLMMASASFVYATGYACYYCVLSILCVTFSLAAAVAFLVDAILQKLTCPIGYLSRLRGVLRFSQAFVACLLLTAATSYFLYVDWYHRPVGMMWALFVFAACLLANVLLILFNLVSLLRALLPMPLSERVYNIVAVLLYLSAAVLWAVYGYWRYFEHREDSRYFCSGCSLRDLHVVTAGALLNLLLYTVDLVMSIKAL